jgi:hypothetical protein
MNRSLALCLFLIACGDNGKSSAPDAAAPDAPPDGPPAAPRAVVVAGDFVTPGFSGVMSSLDLDSLEMTQNVAPAGAIGNDPILRHSAGELFVVNRASGNNVTILDATTFEVREQLSTGAGSNPQDVAIFGNKLFVPAMGTAGVVVVTRGSTEISTIDLSSLDPDGKPDCISAYRLGASIYVACGLLDENFAARGPGKVVVIDAATATVSTTLTLSNPNPFGAFAELPNGSGLVIPTFDFLAPTSRCLEHVSGGDTPMAEGCLVQNADVGGYVARAAVQRVGSSDMLWMIVNNGDFQAERARLWGYDLTTSTLWDEPVTPEGQVLTDVAACADGKVVVADKTMSANGLRVYDGTMEKTTEPLAIGLRPQSSPAVVCY